MIQNYPKDSTYIEIFLNSTIFSTWLAINPDQQQMFAHEALAHLQETNPILLNALKIKPVVCQAILMYYLRDVKNLTNDFKHFDLLKQCVENIT